MEVEACTWVSFDRYVVVDARLIGEGFEQGRNTSSAFFVKVGYGIRAVIARGLAIAKGKTVADKQNALGRMCRDRRYRK